MAEIAALCDVCQKKMAEHACMLCGRRVCKEHFDVKTGTCTSCAYGRGRDRVRHRPGRS